MKALYESVDQQLAAILGYLEGCKMFNFFLSIFTMFFLYTIVSYMIYVQLQILCTLPLRQTQVATNKD